ncbi:MAG: ABC transporter permease [Cellulosilyticaceae bacterium]
MKKYFFLFILLIAGIGLCQHTLAYCLDNQNQLFMQIRLKQMSNDESISGRRKELLNEIYNAKKGYPSVDVSIYTEEDREILDKKVKVYYVDEKLYFQNQVKWLEGGWFTNQDIRMNSPYAIIDERMAISLFRGDSYIGKRFEFENKIYEIIGVTQDNTENVREMVNLMPTMYLPLGMNASNQLNVVWKYEKKDEMRLLQDIEKIYAPFGDVITYRSNEILYPIMNQINITYFIGWTMLNGYIVYEILKRWRGLKNSYYDTQNECYIKEFLAQHRGVIIINIILTIGSFLLLFLYKQFELRIDTNYIPTTLAEYPIVKEKVMEFINRTNNLVFFNTPFRAEANWIKEFMNNLCPILVWIEFFSVIGVRKIIGNE